MKDILLIDDEQDVLDVVRAVLKTRGFHIRTAVGGEEGLQLAREQTPDLIICDLMMPRVSGREVIKQIKADETLAKIPFITLSAIGADKNKPESFWAHGLGVDEFMSKPFDPLDLLGRVEALLRRDSYVQGGNTPKPIKQTATEAAKPVAHIHLPDPETPPAEIASKYIECWNDKNWLLEYKLMAEEMTSAYTYEQYAEARNAAVEEDAGKSIVVNGVIDVLVSANMGKVVLEKSEVFSGGRSWLRKSTVTMMKTKAGWRVMRVKEEPMKKE